ncbi:flavin-containing monooxygenase [Luteipulveratus mongoliensis]|uniref:Monooxygenase n=1 Tax=Luteipulveratus mongoliensis TaxID=571913 RepID=A0A0K1JEE3_9MICO|nr:NAD(P)/FAD-dependent oxidoreductase [Luteipulveratus mongoliensis]AKU15074.1 monooxygenase [Luteipulveratus mongoliensis]
MTTGPDVTAVIIGAGFGGMGMAIQLQRLGIEDFVILDRADDLGGTWQANTYPGVAVDIVSSVYSFSFEPNPYWSRTYAPGSEIVDYARTIADKYDLKRRMQFGRSVTSAAYDEDARQWTVRAEGGPPITATYLIVATGYLSQPRLPDIEGIESFEGKIIHTSAWDHDHDLEGERIAAIGTGASAVQLLPEIAPAAGHLTVYQRTPIWVTPKSDHAVPAETQDRYASRPAVQRAVRAKEHLRLEVMLFAGVLHNKQMPWLAKPATDAALAHLKRQVKDKELREKLTPSYGFGCKRPTFSNAYLKMFNRDNVTLETTPIARITPTGIVTSDGEEREIDTLVLATGFSLWEQNFPAFSITGRDGQDLGRTWRESRFESYEGITVAGYPNLLLQPAPYSYTGLSYFDALEIQMAHVERLFRAMRRQGASGFEPTAGAQEKFVRRMRARVSHSVWARSICNGANSYYFNPHGEATLLRPLTARAGMRAARRFDVSDYQLT